MIRNLQGEDVSRVLNIWTDANLEAHDFILSDFWLNSLQYVEPALLQSEVYINLYNDSITGFIG